jgi:hypothetical protein
MAAAVRLPNAPIRHLQVASDARHLIVIDVFVTIFVPILPGGEAGREGGRKEGREEKDAA